MGIDAQIAYITSGYGKVQHLEEIDVDMGGGERMKYRKKPIIIEAYQTKKEMDIETLEGIMHASIGDYIITGVNGEQYPCKPDIFEKTYEPVMEMGERK